MGFALPDVTVSAQTASLEMRVAVNTTVTRSGTENPKSDNLGVTGSGRVRQVGLLECLV